MGSFLYRVIVKLRFFLWYGLLIVIYKSFWLDFLLFGEIGEDRIN